jgi:hypothetical protein
MAPGARTPRAVVVGFDGGDPVALLDREATEPFPHRREATDGAR